MPKSWQNNNRMRTLAEAIDSIFSEYVLTEIDRIERAKSRYSADTEDVDNELKGLAFKATLPVWGERNEGRKLALAWAHRLTQFKNTTLPTEAMGGLIGAKSNEVKWHPLYFKKDKAYPESNYWITEKEAIERGVDLSEYWLTSRGILEISISGVVSSEEEEMFSEYLRNVLPVNIVLHSVQFKTAEEYKIKLQLSTFNETHEKVRCQISF